MALPDFSMRQLLEAGVHFGHQTHRWNPKMAPFIFGSRNNIHVIDLTQTVPLLYRAMEAVRDVVAGGGRVLFVGTKRQAAKPIAEAARRCAQYYINERWLGHPDQLENHIQFHQAPEILDEQLAAGSLGLTKKELLQLTRQRDKLEASLGGIKDMGGIPDLIFIIDTNKEGLAVQEAAKLGIPVVAILDSNSNPDGILYPIPGNDDASRAIDMYCHLVSSACLDGLSQSSAGMEGDMAEPPMESFEDEPRVLEDIAAHDAQ